MPHPSVIISPTRALKRRREDPNFCAEKRAASNGAQIFRSDSQQALKPDLQEQALQLADLTAGDFQLFDENGFVFSTSCSEKKHGAYFDLTPHLPGNSERNKECF